MLRARLHRTFSRTSRSTRISPSIAPIVATAMLLAACGGAPATPKTPAIVAPDVTALPPPREDGRLPPLATPQKYTLAFDIDPSSPSGTPGFSAAFSGTATIDVDIPEKTSWVVLHGRGLRIKE